jgi:hypothetical protein
MASQESTEEMNKPDGTVVQPARRFIEQWRGNGVAIYPGDY